VLITGWGVPRFIGSNLATRLVEDGARVAVCDAMIEGWETRSCSYATKLVEDIEPAASRLTIS
jgi:nucleoside-diphosphate-sugar epimerase